MTAAFLPVEIIEDIVRDCACLSALGDGMHALSPVASLQTPG